MSEGQQFSPSSALSADQGQEEDDIGAQQKPFEKRPLDPKKRALLKNLVKKNTYAITCKFTLKQIPYAEGYLTLTRKGRFQKNKPWS